MLTFQMSSLSIFGVGFIAGCAFMFLSRAWEIARQRGRKRLYGVTP